jgi:hypothetical protein
LGRTAEGARPQGTLIMPFVVLRSWLPVKKTLAGLDLRVAGQTPKKISGPYIRCMLIEYA